ncbi:MAG: DUF4012 domain-containing protein [Actinomycetota bacterium]
MPTSSSSAAGRSTRGRRRRRRSVALSLIAFMALLLIGDAAWAGWTARSALVSAQEELEVGADALRAGDLTAATEHLQTAGERAEAAESFRRHPSVLLGGLVPFIGDDVRAVAPVARAAGWASSAGLSVVGVARAADWQGGDIPVLEADGRVDLGVLERAQPGLDEAATGLQRAWDEIAGIDAGALLPPLEEAVTDARSALGEQRALVVTVRDLASVLPPMLGADGPTRYLLAFQNLSAPRGTGGYLGFIGVLEAEGGRLRLASLDPVADVPVVSPVQVPPDVDRRYAPFGVRTTMWASNYSPDVPTSSRVAMQIGEEGGVGPVDGVIWADTVWMADMLGAIGPVSSAAWPEPVTSENLVEVFNRRLFESPDSAAIDATQARLGLDLWSALLTRPPEPTALASAMSSGTRGGHLAVYATDEDAQQALERLGAAGTFELGENPMAVVWQDASANRAGFFAEHAVDSQVTLDSNGSAQARTTVTMRNEAPDGPASELLGDGIGGVPIGSWGVDVEVYLPVDAIDPQVTVTGPSVFDVDEAFGHPVADAYLFADPGGRSAATVTYRLDGAAVEADGVWTYRTRVTPRPMLRPVTYSVTISLPEGARVEHVSDGFVVQGDTVRWEGAPAEPTELVVSYAL